MKEKKINLDDAYSLKTAEDSKKLYKKWAQTYDEDFALNSNYLSPKKITSFFNKYSKITGIVMTKYDGSASGGTLISIANKFDIPIYALGNGEALDDLELFNAEKFATQLFAHF